MRFIIDIAHDVGGYVHEVGQWQLPKGVQTWSAGSLERSPRDFYDSYLSTVTDKPLAHFDFDPEQKVQLGNLTCYNDAHASTLD